MTNTASSESSGFETDVNELPAEEANGSEDTLEDSPVSDDEQAAEMENVQKEAAEERKEGGYQ